MRIFLESNVVVSGIVFQGNERAILMATFSPANQFVLSEDVCDEVLGVLREKFPRLQKEAGELLSVIRAEIAPRGSYRQRLRDFTMLRDPGDAHVLAAALSAHCDLVVTGDLDLLRLESVEGTRIVRPNEVLQILRRSSR